MHPGNFLTKASEWLDALDLEQYGIKKEKAVAIHALNMRLFYYPTRLKRVPYDGNKWTLTLKPPPRYLRQGNGDAPDIWEIFSTPLLDCLWDAGHGSVFKCCIPQDSLKLVGYFFVGDYNIIQIALYPTTQAKYTIKLSQSVLDLFSGAAQRTDGKVCVNKTKWYLLEFKWDATGKWSLADNKAGLFLNPPDGLQKIERLP